LKKVQAAYREQYDVALNPTSESCNELASFVPFAERDFPSDSDISKFFPSSETHGIPATVNTEEADDISGMFESRRDLPLTVQLADAVTWRSRQTKRGKRSRSETLSDSNDGRAVKMTSESNKTSSLTVKRRGKGAVIYTDQPDSVPSSASTQTGADDDVADAFVVVDSPPWRRSGWMDADLETTDHRSFTCSLTQPTLSSLRERFGSRATEGRSMPRRCLVDLTDLEEELVTMDDYSDDQMKSVPVSNHEAFPNRLFLVVEELDSPLQRSTSTFDHITCRCVAAVDCLVDDMHSLTLDVYSCRLQLDSSTAFYCVDLTFYNS